MTEKDRTLTDRQRRFVEEYLIDLNATQAGIRAGYSEKTARVSGAETLAKPWVASAVAEAQAERSKRVAMDQNWVLLNLREIVERTMQVAPVLDRKGDPVHIETPDGTIAAAFTFDPGPATRALELVGKHLGMFVAERERTPQSVSLDEPRDAGAKVANSSISEIVKRFQSASVRAANGAAHRDGGLNGH